MKAVFVCVDVTSDTAAQRVVPEGTAALVSHLCLMVLIDVE